ncbi:TonB-dependent receptor [Flectobacillus major]|uniref:TonB-dependent receptor n=1 Tax=Flectobacillus major TaxID=103 RepID=UPI000407882B|nr:TonB-dependent receptor [Flectobacillus major]
MKHFSKKLTLIVALGLISLTNFAQNFFYIQVKDSLSHEPLEGVSIIKKDTKIGQKTDTKGLVKFTNLGNPNTVFVISSVGYQTQTVSITQTHNTLESPLVVWLNTEIETMEEVTISSTRTNSRIEDLPLKVEVLGIDDMMEENTIKPSSISSILGDLSVIHIQQTSATNGNSTVRMQGLDGKYTQILKDGLPLYEGYSGSFGILQIPPLDLKQVEIVKGSVSTLYGGGAIAGMINLISKQPTDQQDLSFTLNRTTLKESNINGYYAQKWGKFGSTIFSGITQQNAVDVNKDGLSDVPDIKNLTFHTKLFYDFSEKTKANIGFAYLTEKRLGGDMQVIYQSPDNSHQYYEKNISERITTDMHFSHAFSANHQLSAKGTVSTFNRSLQQSTYGFEGRQIASFFEASDFIKTAKSNFVYGINFTAEDFKKKQPDSTFLQNYQYITTGSFVQEGYNFTDKLMVEIGFRSDFHNKFGNFFLPRLAFFYKPQNNLSIRMSGGLGYKTPNVFTQQTISGSLRYLLPIDASLKPESSIGINFDLNYHFVIAEKINVQLNQAFYYTRISNPILTNTLPNNHISLINKNYDINSIGTDTYIRFEVDAIELYLGYNHTIAKRVGTGTNVYLPFSPQDKFSSTLAYEITDKWRFGIENSFVANQYINENQPVNNYWFWAGMIERKLGKISIVLNAENIFDFRQSKSEALFLGNITQPTFQPLWGPIDGRVINLAMKIKI